MEKMPYQPELEAGRDHGDAVHRTTSNWRRRFAGACRRRSSCSASLRADDAPSLLAMLTTEEVSRFISPPPTTVEGFERFIAWTHHERENGQLHLLRHRAGGMTTAVGLFQLRSLEPGFGSCEWGFAMGSQFWGTGLFVTRARAILDFGVDASACSASKRARPSPTAAATARCERSARCRKACCGDRFLRHGQYHDQVLWSSPRGGLAPAAHRPADPRRSLDPPRHT
jgi:RimJ/RimL family protein N-acetyltransferase